jgi:CRP/FNR family transcriptional regulator, cyclic AMP receptor protein
MRHHTARGTIGAMAMNLVEALRRVPLLAGIPDREMERLARSMRERSYHEGETVTAEGQGGAGFFVILDGNVTVSVGGDVRRTLAAGDHFGEVALIDEGPRSATIIAATDLRCAGIATWDFKAFVEGHPDVSWSLLQTMARRLREAERG